MGDARKAIGPALENCSLIILFNSFLVAPPRRNSVKIAVAAASIGVTLKSGR
jgi:hypothetical protein